MERKDGLLQVFSKEIRSVLARVPADFDRVQEIRMRIAAPLSMICDNREFFIDGQGRLGKSREDAYIVTRKDLRETVECMSNYSLYALEDEMKQGFITIQGGHRIGLAGRVVTDEHGSIKTIRYVSFINVRLSHEIKGCADGVLPYLCREKRQEGAEKAREEIYHTLIISPPRCGKTTLLRDMIRQVSDGTGRRAGMTTGVVDERSEIAACYLGEPQNDVGIRTDVLDCCPKAFGMMMMIRTMAPQVVAVDEIGSREDLEALRYAVSCGCKILATVHGESLDDIKNKPVLKEMFSEGMFERYILLDSCGKVGHITGIFDSRGQCVKSFTEGGGGNDG